jgi:two-component system, OmpR family, response regulator
MLMKANGPDTPRSLSDRRLSLSSTRILIVEDEERFADAIARGLRAEGFETDVVHDGLDGFRRAKQTTYAAIVLDVLLPRMNGFAVCAELREAGVWTPILMLTAMRDEDDETQALDRGADDYLRKPFAFVVLVARLRALIRRRTTLRPAVLEAGDLRFDPFDQTCTRAGAAIALTPREASVLEYLLRKRGKIVSKSELLDGVWGSDFAGDPNIVEVYVGYLRRKIDAPFGRRTLLTVRGAGYVMEEDDDGSLGRGTIL